jgi:hypothetical protein
VQATSGIYTHSITGTAAANTTLTLFNSSASFPGYFIQIDAYLSTALGLRVSNSAIPLTGTSGAWAQQGGGGNGFRSIDSIKAYAPQLTIIEIAADDSITGSITPTAAYQAAVQQVITACQASGDVILYTCPLSSPTSTLSVPAEQTFNSINTALAAANNCGLVDIASRLGPYSSWGTTYGLASTLIHPNNLGDADIAAALVDALQLVA